MPCTKGRGQVSCCSLFLCDCSSLSSLVCSMESAARYLYSLVASPRLRCRYSCNAALRQRSLAVESLRYRGPINSIGYQRVRIPFVWHCLSVHVESWCHMYTHHLVQVSFFGIPCHNCSPSCTEPYYAALHHQGRIVLLTPRLTHSVSSDR